MISGRQMSELLCLAERASARVVLTGDTRQIQSVEAGDALRILEKESRLKSVSLVQVQRQSDEAYRAAIEELRRDPERGFACLEEIGAGGTAGSIVNSPWRLCCWARPICCPGRSFCMPKAVMTRSGLCSRPMTSSPEAPA